jgi:hypothetical protein
MGRDYLGTLGFAADQDAPVFSSPYINIDAGPETVWDVMSAIHEWPRWNPDISHAVVHGRVAEGVSFTWKSGPATIRSVFRAVDRPKLLAWTGKTMGIPAIHVYRLEGSHGKTQVLLEESWSGFLARLFRHSFQKIFDRAIATGLEALRAEVEQQVAVS